MSVIVLRLNHRINRDKRLSSHVVLTARAFGASECFYSGDKDSGLEKSISNVSKTFGGVFKINYLKGVNGFVKNFKGFRVHLTMYGLGFKKSMGSVKKFKGNVLVIVGGSKVNGLVYDLVDLNMSVGNQPHSEVAALTVFLHEFFDSKSLSKKFINSKINIIPCVKGKDIKQV